MRRLVIPSVLVLASFLSGCGLIGKGGGGEDDPDGRRGVDEDGDGYLSSEGDCDDNDADVNPDAAEACDGVDNNNCDGQIDEHRLDAPPARLYQVPGSAGTAGRPYLWEPAQARSESA